MQGSPPHAVSSYSSGPQRGLLNKTPKLIQLVRGWQAPWVADDSMSLAFAVT